MKHRATVAERTEFVVTCTACGPLCACNTQDWAIKQAEDHEREHTP